MIILYAILVLLAVDSVRPLNKGVGFNVDYIGKDTCNVVKGICIWLVFICHISGYMADIPALAEWDRMLFKFNGYVRQLLVVPFLFYSGYGVTLAIIGKGKSYAESIPRKRVLPTLLKFDVAVLIFVLMNLCLGLDLELKTVLLAFTGWESVRNSNWYIFCILVCYLISRGAYKLGGISRRMLLWVWVGIILYNAAMYFCKGFWWYDTVFSYGFGAVFAYYKNAFDALIKKRYLALLLVSLCGFFIFYNLHDKFSISANITGVFLCCLLVLLTSRVRLTSRLLEWSGRHLFSLYIYQRLPMFVLATIAGGSFVSNHYYWYIVICMVITVLIALAIGSWPKGLCRRRIRS